MGMGKDRIELFISRELTEQALASAVNSRVDLLRQASEHVIRAGWKRIRPRVVLLAYLAGGGRIPPRLCLWQWLMGRGMSVGKILGIHFILH
jgi:hypothetical protein